MKRHLIYIVLLFTPWMIEGQSVADQYLRKIPTLPPDTCNQSAEKQNSFLSKVATLKEEIGSIVRSYNQESQNRVADSEEAIKSRMMQQMSQQYALSPSDMQKMQEGKMTAAEKEALASKILEQQTQMSMQEVQNLSKMNQQGREAYAEAYGTEKMATSSIEPKTTPEASKSINIQQLISKQQSLQTKINTENTRISDLYAAIENNPDLIQRRKNMELWHNKLMSLAGIEAGNGALIDSLARRIANEEKTICEIYTPQYHAALNNHLQKVKQLWADYANLEQTISALMVAQTGTSPLYENQERIQLQAIYDYLERLLGIFRYYRPRTESQHNN